MQIKLINKNFTGNIRRMNERMKRYMQQDAPRIIGTEAVNHFKQSFDDEGFTDKSLKKWKPAKRTQAYSEWYGFQYGARTPLPSNHPRRKGAKRAYKARKANPITNYSPAATRRKTLSGLTGNLKESITYRKAGNRVIVFSNLPYARVHNEGETAKVLGKKSVKMPKRQFMGDSQKLKDKITRELDRDINHILKG
jgi:phage gpG-like protein